MSVSDAAVAMAVGAGLRAFELGQVPDSPAYPYLVISSDIGDPRNYRAGDTLRLSFTLSVQVFGRTASSVEGCGRAADAVFRGNELVAVEDYGIARRLISTPPRRDSDDHGVIALNLVYAFAI